MAMATKEEERKALDKIKKIVEALGEDSYVGSAFKGVFEVAEDNINNDWAVSLADSADLLSNEVQMLTKDLETSSKAKDELQAKLDFQVKMYDDLLARNREEYETYLRILDEKLAVQTENEALKEEITKLKVRLCDMLLKEEE